MRPESLVAQPDSDGIERFRVTRPIGFDLNQAALAMHAVVDPQLAQRDSRGVVGKSRVPAVLRMIAREGWPEDFTPDPDRVAYWRSWLLAREVYTEPTPTQGEIEPMSMPEDVETRFPLPSSGAGYRWCTLNQKGGVGKTALTAGVAGALAARGRRVLLIDLDPQGHLTTEALGLDDVPPDQPSLAGLLTREHDTPLRDLIVTHSKDDASGGRVDVVPTSTEMFLVVAKMYKGRGRLLEWVLDELLNTLEPGTYDHIGIDCPPSLDILTDNALVASNGVLIPVQPARTSLRALNLLLEQISVLEAELRLTPRHLVGMAISLYRRPMAGYARYIAQQLEEFERPQDPSIPPLPVLAHLPLAAAIEEAWLVGSLVVDYLPKHHPQVEALHRVAVALDVAAGLSPQDEQDKLPPLESLAPSDNEKSA